MPSSPKAGRPRKLAYETILKAAKLVMEEEGYASLSMRSLASKLGVSHPTLYNYVRNIEDIETDVLKSLASQLPLPKSHQPGELREELMAFLKATRELTLQHPRVVVSEVGSAAWVTFVGITNQWREALVRHERDAIATACAFAALTSFVFHEAEVRRIRGEGRLEQAIRAYQKHFGKKLDYESEEQVFELVVNSIIDRMLPSLTKKSTKRKATAVAARTTKSARKVSQ